MNLKTDAVCSLLLCCSMILLAPTARADQACPAFEQSSDVGKSRTKDMTSRQQFGSDPDAETIGKFIANGRIVGGNSYSVISDISGWYDGSPFPGTVLLTAHPPWIKSDNPFSIELPMGAIQCLLREDVNVLISDGTYNHFTQFWRLDAGTKRFSFSDRNPDTFFLAKKNNLLGIEAKREKVRNGPVVYWVSEAEFKDVLVELLYPAAVSDFTKLYEFSTTIEQKARVAYAGFFSSAVYSDDQGIETSLRFALWVFDNFQGLTAAQQSLFLKSVEVVLAIAKVTNDRPPTAAILPAGFQIDLLSQIARWDYQSEKTTIKIDKDVIHDVEERSKKYQAASLVDYFGPGEFTESSLDGIQILVAERLGKTAALFGEPQRASRTIKRLMEVYPDSPRMVLYAATLKIRTESPRAALEELQGFIARLEEMTLAAGQVSSLLEFRKSMEEYSLQEYSAEVPYTAWTDLLVEARTLAEKNRQIDLARQFATKELFVVYGQSETLDAFCRQAKRYGRDQKSRVLLQAALKLRRSKWFGVSC